MKIDTSSYYPEPLLPPDGDERHDRVEETADSRDSLFGEPEEVSHNENVETVTVDRTRPGSDKDAPAPRGFIDNVCTLLSWVLVPLLMPVYGMMLVFGLSLLGLAPMSTKGVFVLVVFLINCVIPMLMILLLKKLGFVDDYGLNGQKERLIPYIITIMAMGSTAVYMYFKGAPLWVSLFFAGGALAGLINFIVNFRWKISAHSAGIAGVVALMVWLCRIGYRPEASFVWLLVWIVLAGLLGSARIYMGRHTLGQVLAGYAVGFCCVFIPVLLL